MLSERLNHAFAIHHWQPPAWQPAAAALAAANWPLVSAPTAGAAVPAAEDEEGAASTMVPTRMLLPSMMQPLLSAPRAIGAHNGVDNGRGALACEPSSGQATCARDQAMGALLASSSAANARRQLRLLALATDPSDAAAVTSFLERLLRHGDRGDRGDRGVDSQLASRLVVLTAGCVPMSAHTHNIRVGTAPNPARPQPCPRRFRAPGGLSSGWPLAQLGQALSVLSLHAAASTRLRMTICCL